MLLPETLQKYTKTAELVLSAIGDFERGVRTMDGYKHLQDGLKHCDLLIRSYINGRHGIIDSWLLEEQQAYYLSAKLVEKIKKLWKMQKQQRPHLKMFYKIMVMAT